jgi:hypothetical protein
MDVCCVLSGRGLCDKLITRPEESCRLWCVVKRERENPWLKRPWPTGGLLNQIKKIYHLLLGVGPGSVVGIATSYGLDGPGIEFRCGRDFPHLSRPALGPTQPPLQWVPGLSRGKERPGRDADPSPLLVPWPWKGRAKSLPPIGRTACTTVHFTLLTYHGCLWKYTSICLRVRKIAKRDYHVAYVAASCPSARNDSAPTGRIFMKFDSCEFSKICWENSKFH